jgi:hypothetical protein
VRRWLVRLGWLLASLFAATALFVALMLQPYSLFIVHNNGAAPMTLDVVASGRTVWKGDLPPGAKSFRLSIVDRDTGIAVTCTSAGRPAATTEGGYLTHGAPMVTTITMSNCATPLYDVHVLP